MKMLSKYLVASILAFQGLCHASDKGCEGYDRYDCYNPCERHDPIVGSWAYNFQVDGADRFIYGVIAINADGTFVLNDSFSLTQQLNLAPDGAYFTMTTGTWKRVGRHRYCMVGSNVVLERGRDCDESNRPACLALPATPRTRLKVMMDFELDPCSQSASASIDFTSHKVDDITLSTEGPYPPLSGSIVFQKVTFK